MTCLALLALAFALPACGDDGEANREGGGSATDATAPTDTTEDEPVTGVEIALFVPELGGGARRFKLFCDPPGGTHPRPAPACRALLANQDALAPVPNDVSCTQEFGGDQTAEIHGRVAGEVVEAELNRTNGCEIARWDKLAPVLDID